MMDNFSNKNWLTIFIALFIAGIFFVDTAFAGTLSCTVRTSTCSGGEVEIFEMQNTTNSHAGLPAASYTNLVCCTGVTGLGNDCAAGTKAVALKLSGATNAHVRQGTLADYTGANNACISVPSGGTVSVGYRSGGDTCATVPAFDTTLGSMIGTTNSHIGNGSWTAGTTKICASAAAGTLSADIVDAGGTPISAPSIAMGSMALSFTYQTTNGTFGASAQKIRVDNTTGNAQWSLSLAATAGPTAFWHGTPADYDFNDPTANAGDGGDADSLGGQMIINPSVATITPKSGCTNTGLTLGSSASYSQGVTDSITLLSSGSSAGTNCYWDTTGITVSQTVPKEQPAASDYNINMTLTVTAI